MKVGWDKFISFGRGCLPGRRSRRSMWGLYWRYHRRCIQASLPEQFWLKEECFKEIIKDEEGEWIRGAEAWVEYLLLPDYIHGVSMTNFLHHSFREWVIIVMVQVIPNWLYKGQNIESKDVVLPVNEVYGNIKKRDLIWNLDFNKNGRALPGTFSQHLFYDRVQPFLIMCSMQSTVHSGFYIQEVP